MKRTVYIFIILLFQLNLTGRALAEVELGVYENILKCETPLGVGEQGSRIILYFHYNKENGKAYVVSDPAEGLKVEILFRAESALSTIDMKSSVIYFTWTSGQEGAVERSWASFMYIGNFSWGLHMELSSFVGVRDDSLRETRVIEIVCKETNVFEDVFLN